MLSSNHPSLSSTEEKPLCIWVFHDQRPGHLSQLEGLVNRLSFHRACDTKWFDVSKEKLSIQNFFFKPDFLKSQSTPDLILGAGHSTHLSVVISGFKFNAFTSIIMKPSLPNCFFDFIICPKHDDLEDSNKILSTFGSINKIIPTRSSQETNSRNKNIILIGGPSKHFMFHETQIMNSIELICQSDTNKVWDLSDSPRTPTSLIIALKKLGLTNLNLHSYTDGSFGQLNHVLKQSAFTWVTPDSMSMLYESLTSGAVTAVFDMPLSKQHKPSRIAKHVKQLISEGIVINFKSWQIHKGQTVLMKNSHPSPTLWEAERAALWLLQKLTESGKK